ncbi:MAG: hypothetical protein ACK5XN_22735 [Bacteroidota bacterium]|jgi:hypothetical protein
MRFFITILILGIHLQLLAQSTYVPLQSLSMHLIDRYEIKSGRLADPLEFNTSTRAYQRHRIVAYIDSFNVVGAKLSKQDYFNFAYLQADNFEFTNAESTKSKINTRKVWEYKAAFFGLKSTDYTLVFNPITTQTLGIEPKIDKRPSLNSRGIEMRGTIGKKFGFFTTFSDEILIPQTWLHQFYVDYKAIPGAGFPKLPDGYSSEMNNPPYINYSTASGYVVYQPSKFLDVKFGHGRNFLGNGYRTFYLSDFSRDHLFLRVNTRFWKINYTNIFGEIYDWVNFSQRNLPKRHYYATTYGNINLTKNLNVGLFQTISFQRDSGYAKGGYDLQYLNPIIFFKPLENGLNSPDKTILGADFKWNFLRHFQLYGQAVITEFKIREILSNKGWFGNKWALQGGIKYIDAFTVNNLDIQMEYNVARPYMYTSFNRLNAYVNYNQNMAHPLGANFYEYISIIRYQPTNRLMIKATGILAIYGNDTAGTNFGKDIRLSYTDLALVKPYGHEIAQGFRTTLLMADIHVSWMVKHNLFVDFQFVYRTTTSELARFTTNTVYPNLTIRWNMPERRWDF